MPKNTRILTDIAFKKLANATITNPGNSEFQETIKTNIQLGANTIFSKTPPNTGLPSTLYNTSSDGFVQYVELDLVAVGSSNYDADTFSGDSSNYDDVDSGQGVIDHAYAAKLPAAYETEDGENSDSNSQNPKAGTGFFINGTFLSGSGGTVQIVPPSFGTGYIPVIEDSNGNNPSLGGDSQDFYIDYYSGVVFRQDKASDNSYPVKLKCYIYISDFVTDSLDSAGDTVDLHISASDGNGFSIANAATASFESGSAGVTVTAGSGNTITIGANTDNVTFNSITASAGISSSGAIEATAFIASASSGGTTGFIFRDPDDGNLIDSRIVLTSADNMQFRAGGVFQFFSDLTLNSGKDVTFKDDDNTSFFRIGNISANTGSGDQNNTTLAIKNNQGTALINISGSGNVGIGQNTPTEALELGTGKKIKLTSAADATGSIMVMAHDDDHVLSTFNETAGGAPQQFVIKHNLGNVELINKRTTGHIILSASNGQSVAINTGSVATDGLTVQGNISASGFISSSGGFYGDGSTLSNVVVTNLTDSDEQIIQGSLRLTQDIIAENYIVSSSVTYMTQSFSDGSTIFGDDLTDTHIFTGSLTITGSTTKLTFDGDETSITTTHNAGPGEGSLNIIPGGNLNLGKTQTNKIYIGRNDSSVANYETVLYDGTTTKALSISASNGATFGVPVTASSTISASSYISASDLYLTDTLTALNGGVTAKSHGSVELEVDGNITSSAYILVTHSGAHTGGFVLDRAGSDQYRLEHLDGGLTIVNKTNSSRKEMTFNGSGNVGINNPSPTSLLHLSSSTSDGIRIETQNSANQNGAQLFIEGNKQSPAGTPSRTTIIELKGNSLTRARGIEFTSTDVDYKKWYAGTSYNTDGYTIGYTNTDGAIEGPEYLASSSFFIHNNRKVGIGTTNPSERLEVHGNIQLSGSNNQTRQIEIKASGSGATRAELILNTWRDNTNPPSFGVTKLYKSGSLTFLDTDEDFRIRPNNNGAFRVGGGMGNIYFNSQSNGTDDIVDEVTYFFGDVENKRIGIGEGVTSPAYTLDVTGSGDTDNGGMARFQSNGGGDLIFNDNANGSSETAIKWGANGRISGEGGDFNIQSLGQNIEFYTGSTVALAGPAITITASNGDVGIGTTDPSSKLTVAGDISSSGDLYVSKSIQLSDGLGGYGDAIIEVINDSLDLKDFGNIRLAMDSDGGGGPRTIQFGTGSAGANVFQSLMTISGSGKVGIGTTAPGTELEVIGDISASGLLYASSSDANGTTYQIALVDTASGLFYTTASEAISPTTAESASSVTVTDNADTNAAQAIIFAEPDTGDGVSLQSDATTFTYNPGESGGELQIGATNVLAINEGEIDTANTTFDLLNDTATTINFGGDATTISMGAAAGTVTINGSASIAGDLIVQGTTTSINTDQLNVEDPFILLNSSSTDPNSDGGIIVQTDDSANGTALFYDNSSNRWAIAESSSVAWNVSNDTAVAHQYIVSVSQSAAAPSGDPSNFGLNDATRYGMMYVDTSDTSGDGGLYIYLPG